MKKFLYQSLTIILFFININAQNFDWEWQNPFPTGADHNDAAVLSATKFMLFGNGSSVLTSTDAGNTWSQDYIDAQIRDIYSVTFVDANIGYVAGTGGLLMKTTDGGQSWSEQTSGTTSTLWDVDFIDASTGYVVGASGTILFTSDGGTNWTPSFYGTATLYKVNFINNNLGFIGSSSTTTGRLLRTTNGGSSWDNITANIAGLDGTVRGLHFLDANTGWISNSTGKIFKTIDGGASGSMVYYIGSTTATIYEVKFSDANTGYAISSAGRVLNSTDGGTSWTLTQTSAVKNLYGLGILGVYTEDVAPPILVGGDAGTIIKSLDGVNWQVDFYAASQEILQRAAFPSETVGYTVGGSITTGAESGDILKTTNGGTTWTKLALDPGYRIYSVFFLTENLGYIGVRGPTGVYKTTDGGQNWQMLNTGTGTSTTLVYDIKFYDQNLGFALYQSGQVARTSDAGATWAPISTNWGSAAGYELYVASANVIYACGAGGRLSKSVNGGLSFFQLLPNLNASILWGMHFFDETHGYIAGSSGRIFKTVDGNTFTEMQLPVTSQFYPLRFATSNIGWVGGASGELFYTLNGGNDWTLSNLSIGNSQTIRDLQISGSRLWLVGTDGMIIRGFADPTIPVELTSFSASVSGGSVTLRWETATELNNSGFDILRSVQNENEGWEKIGFVPGFGTTTERKSYAFKDENLNTGVYNYRLKQINYDGTYKYYNLANSVEVTSPDVFDLAQNYPNPFNPVTRINYSIATEINVKLTVFNSIGEQIGVLVNQVQKPGKYEINFNGENLSSGVYFYKLTAGEFVSTKKMLLLK